MNNFEKTLQILQEESPQIVDHLFDTQESIQKYYNEHKKKFKKTSTKGLYKSGDSYNGYYMFITSKGKVDYYVRYTTVNLPDSVDIKKANRQMYVRGFRESAESVGIPKITFFEYLLPTFGAMVSDTQQTQDGKRYWEYAVKQAIDEPEKYGVYVLDKTKGNLKIYYSEYESFINDIDNIWGTKNFFQHVTIIIYLK